MAVLREVVIEWLDDPEPDAYLVTVCIDKDWAETEDAGDDNIFFYFSSEEEFEQARAGIGYEFRIIEWEED